MTLFSVHRREQDSLVISLSRPVVTDPEPRQLDLPPAERLT